MEMADIGQSSLTCQETWALAELAEVMGKPRPLQEQLKARAGRLAELIGGGMWDPASM